MARAFPCRCITRRRGGLDAVSRLQPPQRRVMHRSEEHTSELQSQSNLVCRLLLEKKKNDNRNTDPDHSTSTLQSCTSCLSSFVRHDPATLEIYTLSLHDALPISAMRCAASLLQAHWNGSSVSMSMHYASTRWPRCCIAITAAAATRNA